MIRLLVTTFLLLSALANAEERVEFYTGVRALGMGGVVVPTVNDETALISNPAALGRLRNSFFTLADPEVSGDGGAYGVGTQGPVSDLFDPLKNLEYLNENPKDEIYTKIQFFPSFVTKNFGIGILGRYEYSSYLTEREDSDSFRMRYKHTNDYSLILGYNLRIWEGRIKLGFNVRGINRIEVKETYNDNVTTIPKISDLAREGGAIASDVGLILTGPWDFLPNIAAVWRDVGNTKFNQNDGLLLDTQERPRTVRQDVDVGMSVSPIISNGTRLVIGGEFRGVLTYGDEPDIMKRVHAGVELNMYDVLFLRGGMNQRYWTAGLEFNFGLIQFQAASYGEEIGTKDSPREDRRYVGKIAIRF